MTSHASRYPRRSNRRLHALLDKQERGEPLTEDELAEAQGVVDLAVKH